MRKIDDNTTLGEIAVTILDSIKKTALDDFLKTVKIENNIIKGKVFNYPLVSIDNTIKIVVKIKINDTDFNFEEENSLLELESKHKYFMGDGVFITDSLLTDIKDKLSMVILENLVKANQ